MFILKKGHQPGVYVPLRALFLVDFVGTPPFRNRMIGCHGNYEFYIAHIMFFSHCGSNKQYGINEKLSWDERFVKLDSGVNPLPRHEDIMDLCNFGLNLTVFSLQ